MTRGWDVMRAIDVYPERTPDPVVFERAALEGRVFVSNDEGILKAAAKCLEEGRPFRMIFGRRRTIGPGRSGSLSRPSRMRPPGRSLPLSDLPAQAATLGSAVLVRRPWRRRRRWCRGAGPCRTWRVCRSSGGGWRAGGRWYSRFLRGPRGRGPSRVLLWGALAKSAMRLILENLDPIRRSLCPGVARRGPARGGPVAPGRWGVDPCEGLARAARRRPRANGCGSPGSPLLEDLQPLTTQARCPPAPGRAKHNGSGRGT